MASNQFNKKDWSKLLEEVQAALAKEVLEAVNENQIKKSTEMISNKENSSENLDTSDDFEIIELTDLEEYEDQDEKNVGKDEKIKNEENHQKCGEDDDENKEDIKELMEIAGCKECDYTLTESEIEDVGKLLENARFKLRMEKLAESKIEDIEKPAKNAERKEDVVSGIENDDDCDDDDDDDDDDNDEINNYSYGINLWMMFVVYPRLPYLIFFFINFFILHKLWAGVGLFLTLATLPIQDDLIILQLSNTQPFKVILNRGLPAETSI